MCSKSSSGCAAMSPSFIKAGSSRRARSTNCEAASKRASRAWGPALATSQEPPRSLTKNLRWNKFSSRLSAARGLPARNSHGWREPASRRPRRSPARPTKLRSFFRGSRIALAAAGEFSAHHSRTARTSLARFHRIFDHHARARWSGFYGPARLPRDCAKPSRLSRHRAMADFRVLAALSDSRLARFGAVRIFHAAAFSHDVLHVLVARIFLWARRSSVPGEPAVARGNASWNRRGVAR